MIKTLNILLISILLSSLGFSQEVNWQRITVCNGTLQLNETEHDFGVLQSGDKATFKFVFENLADELFIIKHVTTSCGCTSPSWTKKPQKKGKKLYVKVTYNTETTGSFNKSVYVYTNFQEQPIHLKIFGKVMPAISEKSGFKKKTFNLKGTLPQNQ